MSSAGHRQREEAYALGAAEFEKIAAMLHEEAGIYLAPSKASMVFARLARRLRELGLESFESYARLVDSAEGKEERQNMIAALTTNVTKFMREPHHFEHLRRYFETDLLPTLRRDGEVRIWSAGCSSGQEPYSIAMTILSAAPEAARKNFRILGTDIDPNMIETGEAGNYPAEEAENVPPAMLSRWFGKTPTGQISAGAELRSVIAFRRLNLMEQWPLKHKYHAIFCRNVAIYFDDATQARLWSRFQDMLAPRGVLYIGHSERISGPAQQGFTSEGVTIYRLNKGH